MAESPETTNGSVERDSRCSNALSAKNPKPAAEFFKTLRRVVSELAKVWLFRRTKKSSAGTFRIVIT
jgi:hypothetical protein